MKDKMIAFLPCRKGSERVPNKNTRMFSDIEGGLSAIKIRQLVQCNSIDSIVISTDDPIVEDIARKFSKKYIKDISVHERPKQLASSNASTDDIIKHVQDLIPEGNVLWTHVTSPFVDQNLYSKAIEEYRNALLSGEWDSLMSVTKIQTFIWDDNGPINYQRSVEKWPRTQTLPCWYEINSALFIAPIITYRNIHDRIGRYPVLFPLDYPASVDIDTIDQFRLAESIWKGMSDG